VETQPLSNSCPHWHLGLAFQISLASNVGDQILASLFSNLNHAS